MQQVSSGPVNCDMSWFITCQLNLMYISNLNHNIYQMIHLIDESLFNQLSCIRGFNECNGSTYKDYLILNLLESKEIEPQVKNILRELRDSQTILKALKSYKICYSHTYQDSES